ncbi:MAG: DUF5615 family PIN-like protein [Bacteroidetes bacterium]|nr:DUF5615 family PIN-like protein [Bacteroidota bacterium]
MKLLLDQNISYRIKKKLKPEFDCTHVGQMGMNTSSDIEIWEYARSKNLTIVTFDSDFFDISVIKGHPPKILWLRTFVQTTSNLAQILNKNSELIGKFLTDEDYSEISCLELG